MKSLRTAILLLLLTILPACDKDYWDTSCDNCFEEKPEYALLEIEVKQNADNPAIPVKIFRMEKGDRIWILNDTLSDLLTGFWVPVGFRYAVEAYYDYQGETIIVVDQDRVDVIYDEENCDSPCYRPNNGKVDCRLKISP